LKFVDRTLRQQEKLAADVGKSLVNVFDRNSFLWTASGGHRTQTLSDRFPFAQCLLLVVKRLPAVRGG
jgi:hypothetical protein